MCKIAINKHIKNINRSNSMITKSRTLLMTINEFSTFQNPRIRIRCISQGWWSRRLRTVHFFLIQNKAHSFMRRANINKLFMHHFKINCLHFCVQNYCLLKRPFFIILDTNLDLSPIKN